MADYTFHVGTPGEALYDGHKKLNANVATARNGTLLELSSGEWIVDTGAGNVRGALYEFRQFVEFPVDENVAADMAGKYVNVARGTFMALIGADHFVGGTIPAVGSKLYAGASGDAGKYKTTAASGVTIPIGEVEGTTTYTNENGVTVTVAIVRLDLNRLSYVDAIE